MKTEESRSPTPSHSLFLDSREAHALIASPSGLRYRHAVLALQELRRGPATERLLASTAWPHLLCDGRIFLLGGPARDLALIFGTPPPAPIRFGSPPADPVAERALDALLGRVLDPWPRDGGRLEVFLPPDATELQCPLPVPLLRSSTLPVHCRSVLEPIRRAQPSEELRWLWVFAEGSVSIGVSYRGAPVRTVSTRGLSTVRSVEAGGGAETDPSAFVNDLRARQLLQSVIEATLPLSREAWARNPSPGVRIEIVAPDPYRPLIQALLPPTLQSYRIGDAEIAVEGFGRFLGRGAAAVAAGPQKGRDRPQAIRPRASASPATPSNSSHH